MRAGTVSDRGLTPGVRRGDNTLKSGRARKVLASFGSSPASRERGRGEGRVDQICDPSSLRANPRCPCLSAVVSIPSFPVLHWQLPFTSCSCFHSGRFVNPQLSHMFKFVQHLKLLSDVQLSTPPPDFAHAVIALRILAQQLNNCISSSAPSVKHLSVSPRQIAIVAFARGETRGLRITRSCSWREWNDQLFAPRERE